jgi:DNA-binding CsgD family transcriptional regulator
MGGAAPSGIRGRNNEQRILDRLLENVRGGHSSTLVIRGEAGVGKSALLHYVAHGAAAEFTVVEIAGVESEMQLAYAALHQLCSPMLEHLGGLPDPQRSALNVAFGLAEGKPPDHFLVGLATLSLLAEVAERRPLICLIDEAQWLDDASSEVLGFAARRLGVESVAMVFAVRDRRDDGRFASLPEMLVGGIPAEEARALLARVVPGRLDEQVRDRIIAETGGNPLALLELPRGMTPAELAGGFGVPRTGGVAVQIEDAYLKRMRSLPEPTQRLMLLAAADAVGDATTIWRAASAVGIGIEDAGPAADEGLLEIGEHVRFRHPLVRSAVYHSASAADRRAAHTALAGATDPVTDPDRRAWHRAHGAAGPDAEVAAELERSAGRAQARGGLAAAAALLERSASLTADPARRVERRLAAAQTNLRAGAFGAALGLLAVAESEADDDFVRARVDLLRGLVASASKAGSDAPLQLLKAAQRLEELNPALARQTYLDAWGAALFAGHLAAPGGDLAAVSRAAAAAPRPPGAAGPFDDLLDGLATLITKSRAVAAPTLRRAVRTLLTSEIPDDDWLHWGVLASSAAVTLWDFESWTSTSGRQVALARDSGALGMLSIALNGEGMIAAWAGDFERAAALAAEDQAIKHATGSQIAPYGAMLLAAYQGRTAEASTLVAATIEDSVARGEGLGVDLARWTAAILNNSLARYAEALAAGSPASSDTPGLYISTWMLLERIEAAVRCGYRDVAASALEDFESSAHTGDSDWGCGVQLRARALLSDGDVAEGHYRAAIQHLRRTRIRTELARTHLLFGEWLRRHSRRVDAREQLRTAHDMFLAMPAYGFAERARHELLATGEHVRAHRAGSADELTPQEQHIARLAKDGRTNPEFAAELYISARTVEWHLRKIFTKLDIGSRRELRNVWAGRREGTAAT